ncbi:MAG TPA: PQQ-dependent sugar dehydrogenase, partial [Cryomorphaceae bacterium]|nr:PQQ-dependent sugar dehydrogenase [Cryomorphaceae bacterium]
ITVLISSICLGQGIYFEPVPTSPAGYVRLYVDVSSSECNCEELIDGDNETNPLYFWSWQPTEMRPDLIIDGETVDITNGEWAESNENMRMTQDEFDSNLWFYDFQGVPLPEFYSVPIEEFENGVSFLIKEKNGAPQDQPEQKSPDLNLPVEFQTTENFSIAHETLLSEISSATTITHAGDERIFATEQPGRIRVFYRDGVVEQEPFMDIEDRVQDTGGEQGLLGLAFDPDFCESGRFYVNYTANDGGLVTRISRFETDAENPLVGDPDSEEILIQFDQDFANHNGGHIEFGPDGYLYIATGDGGSGGDPNERAQDITSYLGKMLRIDVSPETGYDIPLDNPYIFDDFGQDEIWSFGLRNPWKFAFDKMNGNMYIADVGQNAFEEVNFEPAGTEGGRNYGWDCFEGFSSYEPDDCEASDYIFPAIDYPHSGGGFSNCSVTGGRVYRGLSFELFSGWFFYTDLCSGAYWAITELGGTFEEQEFGTIGQSFVSTFGEDVWGEIYFSNSNGIHRLLDPNDELLNPITQVDSELSSTYDGVFYQWFFNGESIGTGPTLEVDELGVYTLVVTTSNGICQVESSFEVTSLGMGDYSSSRNSLTVFPNPAQESITVDLESYSRAAHSLAIYTVDGRLVHAYRVNSDRLELDLNKYVKGVFVLNLLDRSGNSIAQSKLIKQ